jgi:pyruvate formate lyase activating enzyme
MRITPEEVIQLYLKNHKFYQNDGGITMSGGEPLIHQDFCLTLAKLCKKQKINLALDTSGATFSKSNLSFYKKLIKHKPL